MKNIQLFNCFDCANGFYLIEAVINDKSGKIDFSRFSPNRRKGDENAECADSKLYAIQFSTRRDANGSVNCSINL